MSELQQGLLITAIGMGLVFVVIIFLWGLMALLVRLTTRKEPAAEAAPAAPDVTDEPLVPEMQTVERQRRAAAAAAAAALAIAARRTRQKSGTAPEPADRLSPWQAVHRARQLQNLNKRG
jgi:Na+-transporting methylmalonyl-CoA/oxaloacetate decarboxylase gamma subunit